MLLECGVLCMQEKQLLVHPLNAVTRKSEDLPEYAAFKERQSDLEDTQALTSNKLARTRKPKDVMALAAQQAQCAEELKVLPRA